MEHDVTHGEQIDLQPVPAMAKGVLVLAQQIASAAGAAKSTSMPPLLARSQSEHQAANSQAGGSLNLADAVQQALSAPGIEIDHHMAVVNTMPPEDLRRQGMECIADSDALDRLHIVEQAALAVSSSTRNSNPDVQLAIPNNATSTRSSAHQLLATQLQHSQDPASTAETRGAGPAGHEPTEVPVDTESCSGTVHDQAAVCCESPSGAGAAARPGSAGNDCCAGTASARMQAYKQEAADIGRQLHALQAEVCDASNLVAGAKVCFAHT